MTLVTRYNSFAILFISRPSILSLCTCTRAWEVVVRTQPGFNPRGALKLLLTHSICCRHNEDQLYCLLPHRSILSPPYLKVSGTRLYAKKKLCALRAQTLQKFHTRCAREPSIQALINLSTPLNIKRVDLAKMYHCPQRLLSKVCSTLHNDDLMIDR